MPSRVGIRELNSRLSEYIEAVETGREIEITRHGRLVARLVPVEASLDHLATLRARGLVRDPVAPKRLIDRGRIIKGEGPISDLFRPRSPRRLAAPFAATGSVHDRPSQHGNTSSRCSPKPL